MGIYFHYIASATLLLLYFFGYTTAWTSVLSLKVSKNSYMMTYGDKVTWKKVATAFAGAFAINGAFSVDLSSARAISAPASLTTQTSLSLEDQLKAFKVSPVSEAVVPPSLQDQVKILNAEKQEKQKLRVEENERQMLSEELKYPEGKLIARGLVYLDAQPSAPMGYESGSELSPDYNPETSTIFLLGNNCNIIVILI